MNIRKLRLKIFLSILIDFLVINIIFSINNPKNILIYGPRYYMYVFFWFLISYVFDRYYRDDIKYDINKIVYQIDKSFKSICTYGLILLLFNWILGNYISRSFLLIFLINLFIFSSIIQYLLYKFTYKNLKKSNYWIVIDNENMNNLYKEKFFNKDNFKIFNINKLEINSEILESSCGIIINNYENFSLDFLVILKI